MFEQDIWEINWAHLDADSETERREAEARAVLEKYDFEPDEPSAKKSAIVGPSGATASHSPER